MNWGLIGKKVAGNFTGLNWWKWGAYLLVIVALLGGGYMTGKNRAELKCEEEKTALAEAKTEKIIEFVEVQVPIIQEREVKSTEIRYVTRNAGEKLNEAINKKPDVAGCDLSADEFLRWNEIAGATRR